MRSLYESNKRSINTIYKVFVNIWKFWSKERNGWSTQGNETLCRTVPRPIDRKLNSGPPIKLSLRSRLEMKLQSRNVYKTSDAVASEKKASQNHNNNDGKSMGKNGNDFRIGFSVATKLYSNQVFWGLTWVKKAQRKPSLTRSRLSAV